MTSYLPYGILIGYDWSIYTHMPFLGLAAIGGFGFVDLAIGLATAGAMVALAPKFGSGTAQAAPTPSPPTVTGVNPDEVVKDEIDHQRDIRRRAIASRPSVLSLNDISEHTNQTQLSGAPPPDPIGGSQL